MYRCLDKLDDKEKDKIQEVSVSYTRKMLARILAAKRIALSVGKGWGTAKAIATLKIHLPLSNEAMTKTMLVTKRQQAIALLFNENFWKNT